MNESSRDRGCRGSGILAGKLAALSHPARIDILRYLGRRESCSCREVVERLDLAQSTVSQHLKILVEAGLVRYSADRQRSRYELDRTAMADLCVSVSALADACCSVPAREETTLG